MKYDIILGLGTSCQTAYNLNRFSLRSFSSPFDWLVTPLSSIIQLIDNKFNNFCLYENLEVIGNFINVNVDKEYLVVKDSKYNIISYHDFPINEQKQVEYKIWLNFQEKINRRVTRFYQTLRLPKKILFVIQISKTTEIKLCHELYNTLFKYSYKSRIHLMVCGYFPEQKNDSKGINLVFYKFTKLPNIKDKDNSWKGNSKEWDRVLADLTLTKV